MSYYFLWADVHHCRVRYSRVDLYQNCDPLYLLWHNVGQIFEAGSSWQIKDRFFFPYFLDWRRILWKKKGIGIQDQLIQNYRQGFDLNIRSVYMIT